MKNNNKDQEVESNFDRNETISINHIPVFESVKSSGLHKIRRNVVEKVAFNTDFDPGALQMALKGIDGQFNPAYKTLEGDYDVRLANLKQAYRDGLQAVRRALRRYELQAQLHNAAFDRYNAANQVINGAKLSEALKVDPAKIASFKQAIDNLTEAK